jgi:hypothetical protein
MSEKADFEPSLKRASHFVKIIVACPHRLPKLPESTLRKQARPNNGSLFYSHCDFPNTPAAVLLPFFNFSIPIWLNNERYSRNEKRNL